MRGITHILVGTFALVAAQVLVLSAAADTLHVPDEYPTIQLGMDVAQPGDIVLVADGVYTGVGNKNLNFYGKAITVRSENGAENCIIDCENDGRGFSFYIGVGPDAIVEGLTIRNGYADYGGGVYCWINSNPTLTNCTISGNSTYYYDGGGVYCYESSPTLTNCTISGNSAYYLGGGVYCYYSSPTLTNCTISGNSADAGGGVFCYWYSSPTLTNCTISGNSTYYYGGAGVFCWDSSPTLTNCTISGNTADDDGGGVECDHGSPTLTNCTISGNTADHDGGGVSCHDYSNPTLTNCTITGNTAYDGGGGVYCHDSDPTLTNCILWADSAQEIYGTPMATYCDVQGGWTGEGNIDADPLFGGAPSGVWTANGMYDPETYQVTFTDDNGAWATNQYIGKLLNPDTSQPLQFVIVTNTMTTITVWADWATIDAEASWVTAGMSYQLHNYDLDPLGGSPCVDAANNQAVPPEVETDIAGRPRFVDDPETPDTGHGDPPIVDMGAYEYQGWVLGDLNCDGVLDFEDINPFVLTLTNPAQYESLYPYCSILRADVNDDGQVDFEDINPFVALLSGG